MTFPDPPDRPDLPGRAQRWRLDALAGARRRAGGAVFERVAGPDGRANRDRIHRTPGPRWFEAGSPIQVVHGDASMFVGGLLALLLQSLHPAAMAAVAGHSGYQGDPWGRLARTSTFLAFTTFGTADDAAAAVARVRGVHDRIRGTTPDGISYAAGDPELLAWVHVAEVHSFLSAHRRYGAHPLGPADRDRYVAQAAVVGRALGAADVPETVAALRARMAGYRRELRATPAALDAARFILLEPPLPAPVRPVYAGLAGAAVLMLPAWARTELRLGTPTAAGAAAARLAGATVTHLIRWAMAADPPPDPAPDPTLGPASGPASGHAPGTAPDSASATAPDPASDRALDPASDAAPAAAPNLASGPGEPLGGRSRLP